MASRRQTGRRDMVSLRSGFPILDGGEGALKQGSRRLMQQGAGAPVGTEFMVTYSAPKT